MNGIYLQIGKKGLPILIKKNQLAKEIENQRPSRFVKGDKLDAIITELDKEKREISLSIKALEEKQTREAVKKYGSKDSGASLGEILGPIFKGKKEKYHFPLKLWKKNRQKKLLKNMDPKIQVEY